MGSEEPGVALDGGELLVALPLVNRGASEAEDVRVHRIWLRAHELVAPELPLAVGDVEGGGDTVLQLAFERTRLSEPKRYQLTLLGSHRIAGRWWSHRRLFVVRQSIPLPLPDEGERTIREAVVEPRTVEGAAFPPSDIEPRLAEEPEGRPLPLRRNVANPEPDNPSVSVSRLLPRGAGGAGDVGPAASGEVVFIRASAQPLSGADTKGGAPWDPSGASVDLQKGERVVFLTGNLYALLSTDGGATFKHLDPTTIFGNIPLDEMPPDLGLCCDMNLIYLPSIDRFVWVLLTKGSKIGENDEGDDIFGFNRLRVATASSAQVIASGGTSWTYWDMTTKLFGFGKSAFLDYPDVSFTDSYLHISVVRPDVSGFFVIRVPLADVQFGGTIHIGYTNPADGTTAAGARLAHDSPDAAYWFGHDSNVKVRIFEWLDNSNSYSWHSLPVTPWIDANSNYVSFAPGLVNWLEANTSAIRGATFQGEVILGGGVARTLVIAWNAPRRGNFLEPYVRLLPVTKVVFGGITEWVKGTEFQIWNNSFAFHHAHLPTNSNGEVGVSVGAGGGGSHATPVAGFVGDPTLYAVGVSSATLTRYGDYTAIRPHWPNTKLFSVTDYFLEATPGGGFLVKHQYRMFERSGDEGSTF